MTYLNNTQLSLIQARLVFYQEAEARTGVPWALMVALHYRESNFAGRVARVGGPFQADPPWSAEQVRAWGSQYGVSDLTNPETDLRTAILCAAAFCQVKAAARNTRLKPDSSLDEIADVAWSYNGRAYGSWKNSPYVSNDPQNGVQLHLTGTVPDIHDPSKRIRIDQLDTRPGVLAIIREVRQRVTLPQPAPSPVVSASTGPRLLLADKSGKFGVAPDSRFIYHGLMFSPQANGDTWVRLANPDEL